MQTRTLTHQIKKSPLHVSLNLPTSKSESNRALVLQHLSGENLIIKQLSDANDTVLLKKLLANIDYDDVLDCGPAGTTFRFLTAILSFFSKKSHILTGSKRMKERPIKDLVDALRMLGADITYLEQTGFPPLKITPAKQTSETCTVNVSNSSQYLTSLLLIGGFLPKGITIKPLGKLGSEPYVAMTLSILKKIGICYTNNEQEYVSRRHHIKPTTLTIEADWSGASYWFSRLAMETSGSIQLNGLQSTSLQGDQVVCSIFEKLGVKSQYNNMGLLITKAGVPEKELVWDFTHCPDLAQTVIPCCAILGVQGKFTGLASLRIKETDRIKALQTELAKLNASLVSSDEVFFSLTPIKQLPEKTVQIATYHDHRMAMGFAPLAARLKKIIIEDPNVVDKSYPNFWEHLAKTDIS